MATNMDKSLYQAPQGIEQGEPIEIEVVNPEELHIHAGPLDIHLGKEEEDNFDANLADEIPENQLQTIASDLSSDIDNDKGSRADWEKAYTEGLKLMGLQYEERTEPWNGASGVFHPMITEAVVRFQSETITEMFPAAGPVRTKIIGIETPEKKQAAQRVEEDMNYELTEVMREFRPEQERMLWSLPATGSAFKKVYFDPNLNRQVSMFIPAEDILLPYGATDLDTCHRITHVMRKTKNEIIKLQNAGFYIECDLPDPQRETTNIQKAKDSETGFRDMNDDRYTLYETHVDLDIEGYEDEDSEGVTGIALPYVVTMIKGTNTVLSIRRNWLQDDKLKLKRQHFVHYQYIPGFGAYGFGLFHLIGGFAKSATSIMRQLVDAGTLSNLPGGLKSRGLRIKGDDTPIAPGEFRDVDIGSGALRDNILPLPYKEPSQVLYTLLNNIVEEGRRFAATADMQISDMSSQAPVGTTLALLERQLKVMSAVQARLHYSFKQELRLLAEIIRDDSPSDYDYDPDTADRSAKKSDYQHVDIIPVSDPNAATLSQRVVQYQAVMQMAQSAPNIYNMPQLHRNMLEILGIKNPDKLVPLPEDETVTDPVTENMNVLKGVPLKAFLNQDHQSHIAVHMGLLKDPIVQQLIGQNPQAQAIQAALMAHIAEHTGYQYRKQIETQLGMSLPADDDDLDPQIEYALSGMLAQASQQALQINQQQAQQQQAQQQAQDPMVQMQQQQLQMQQQELQLKAQQMQQEFQLEQQKLQLEAQKIQLNDRLNNQKLSLTAQEKAKDAQLKEAELRAKMQLEGTKLGNNVRRDQSQHDMQRNQMKSQTALQIAKQKAEQQREGMKMGIDVARSKAEHEHEKAKTMIDIAKHRATQEQGVADKEHEFKQSLMQSAQKIVPPKDEE